MASRGATTKTATLTACGGAVLEEEELVLLGVRQLRLGAGEELIGLALALLEVPPVKLRTDAVRMASWARPGSSATAVLRGLRCWTPPHECGGQPQAFRCSQTSCWWPIWWPAVAPPRLHSDHAAPLARADRVREGVLDPRAPAVGLDRVAKQQKDAAAEDVAHERLLASVVAREAGRKPLLLLELLDGQTQRKRHVRRLAEEPSLPAVVRDAGSLLRGAWGSPQAFRCTACGARGGHSYGLAKTATLTILELLLLLGRRVPRRDEDGDEELRRHIRG